MNAAVMLPTYNEAGNIERVVEQIVAVSEDISAVVVDDNSPGGTGDIADNLANRLPGRVHVVHRQGRRDRGVAGVERFKYCLSLSVDYVGEMDADLSHDPMTFRRFSTRRKAPTSFSALATSRVEAR